MIFNFTHKLINDILVAAYSIIFKIFMIYDFLICRMLLIFLENFGTWLIFINIDMFSTSFFYLWIFLFFYSYRKDIVS